jgi:hypothetical protein
MVALGTNMELGFASLHDSAHTLQSLIRSTGSDIQTLIRREFEGLHNKSMARVSMSEDNSSQSVRPM